MVLALRSRKDRYKDCFELNWIWLTVWFWLNLNLSRVKVPCLLFLVPRTNEIFTRFRNWARFEDKCKSCLSAHSPASQASQLTRNPPSSICLFDIAQLCFQHCQNTFQPAWRSSRTWVPLQGCGSFCLQRCTAGEAVAPPAQQTQSNAAEGREWWHQWAAGPFGLQQPLLQNWYRPLQVHLPCTTDTRPVRQMPSC